MLKKAAHQKANTSTPTVKMFFIVTIYHRAWTGQAAAVS